VLLLARSAAVRFFDADRRRERGEFGMARLSQVQPSRSQRRVFRFVVILFVLDPPNR
jgi:hypothetical protein